VRPDGGTPRLHTQNALRIYPLNNNNAVNDTGIGRLGIRRERIVTIATIDRRSFHLCRGLRLEARRGDLDYEDLGVTSEFPDPASPVSGPDRTRSHNQNPDKSTHI
jgi:hypothetical protein